MENLRKILKENITIKEKTYELPTRANSTDIIPGDIVEYKAVPVDMKSALRKDFQEGMGVVVKVNNKSKKVTVGVLENRGRSSTNDEKTKWGLSGEKVEVLMKDCQIIKKKEQVPQALLKAVVKLAKLGWKITKGIGLGAGAATAGALALGSSQAQKYMDK
jgi:hypothetical protein